jgi:hypothetical protein
MAGRDEGSAARGIESGRPIELEYGEERYITFGFLESALW